MAFGLDFASSEKKTQKAVDVISSIGESGGFRRKSSISARFQIQFGRFSIKNFKFRPVSVLSFIKLSYLCSQTKALIV